MIYTAIVEDNDSEAELLTKFLTKYQEENGEEFRITRYGDGESFLTDCSKIYDIVFMDIEMPYMNGMTAAKKLRESDKKIVIVFVTNMAQYAIKGYEVNALDYILKPIKYQDFLFRIKRAIDIIKDNEEKELAVKAENGFVRISTKKLEYVEVMGHKLICHVGSEQFVTGGSLTNLEGSLKSKHFLRCNSCYLVNPKHIERVKGQYVVMKNGDELKISQPKRKSFLTELSEWLGMGNFT